MRILGIDPATKSLAITIVEYNENWKIDILNIRKQYAKTYCKSWPLVKKINIFNAMIREIRHIKNNIFSLLYVNVFDLIPGKKTKETTIELRISRLKSILSNITHINNSILPTKHIDVVLVEKQMSIKNIELCACLLYNFIPIDNGYKSATQHISNDINLPSSCKVYRIGPTLKNKVYFGVDGMIQNFYKKYLNNYTANKKHAVYNFLKWIKIHKMENMISHIKKNNLDDVADSFLMIYGWCKKIYNVF